jgi:hypothetical protein
VARKSETLELDGDVKVTSEALAWEPAEDILPDVAEIISTVVSSIAPKIASGEISGTDDVLTLLPALGALVSTLGNGKLKALAPKILAGTSVVMPDDQGLRVKYDLIKKDDRAACFEARPDLYFRILFFAGKVTFARFFPGRALASKGSQKAT